jgi:hypothetical protein
LGGDGVMGSVARRFRRRKETRCDRCDVCDLPGASTYVGCMEHDTMALVHSECMVSWDCRENGVSVQFEDY